MMDMSTGEDMEKLGCFASRYPEICPFCFSKYPDDPAQKMEHIRGCKRLLQEIGS
jgi:hypothetical protein